MNEREKLMYGIISNISQADVPIVFKGGLITGLILKENNFTQIERTTKDIDANWIGKPPTMKALASIINESFGKYREHFTAVPERDYNEFQSAGISILENKTGDKIISMDIDIRSITGSRVYNYGETSIKGVLVNEILLDKIIASSSNAVYKWRAKDIIDVYMLSQCVRVSTNDIYNTSVKLDKHFHSFEAFYNKKVELQHAYERLKGIEGKPDFEGLYNYLKVFFQPFVKCELDKIWDSKKNVWIDERCLSMDNWKKMINSEIESSSHNTELRIKKHEIENKFKNDKKR